MIERKPFFWELLQKQKPEILQQLDRRAEEVSKELEALQTTRNTYPKGEYIIDIKPTQK